MENKNCTKCNSINIYFVKYKMKNGVDVLRKQCNDCGYLLTLNYKRNFVKNFNELNYFNDGLRNGFKEKQLKKAEINNVFYHFANEHFNRSYNYYHNVYLKSDEWKTKRNLVMDFYNNTCNDCGDIAVDVHHETYERIFKEKFSDLTPLCRNCHQKKHDYVQN